MQPSDHILRIAELVELAAETAEELATLVAAGDRADLAEAARRIEEAAEELKRVGRTLERRPQPS